MGMSSGDASLMARAQRAFELNELAEALMLQNLRRRFPEETGEQIERRLLQWLQERPDAPHGDAAGPVRVRRVFE
jgi:Rv0078B-related antitoxin